MLREWSSLLITTVPTVYMHQKDALNINFEHYNDC